MKALSNEKRDAEVSCSRLRDEASALEERAQAVASELKVLVLVKDITIYPRFLEVDRPKFVATADLSSEVLTRHDHMLS